MTKHVHAQFEKLQREHDRVGRARQEAAAHRASIKGIGGPLGDLTALASDIGTAAIETELALLKAERKALKKLHAFASKAVAKAEAARQQS